MKSILMVKQLNSFIQVILPLIILTIIVGLRYDLTFYPYDVDAEIMEFKNVEIKEYIKDISLVFKYKNKKYQWKNNKILMKGKGEIGYYPVLLFEKN